MRVAVICDEINATLLENGNGSLKKTNGCDPKMPHTQTYSDRNKWRRVENSCEH